MGDIWQNEKLVIFLIMFVPGFISLKVWDLFIPSERRDFSKSLVDAVAYSAINFAALFWLVDYLSKPSLAQLAPKTFLFGNFLLFFAFPVVWPIALFWLMKWPVVAKHIVNPMQKPWDYVFAKRERAWVLVHLKNGGVVGGRFDSNSYASSYPAKEQIYLEELWQLDASKNFVKRIDRTKGSIILGDDILAVEFFE